MYRRCAWGDMALFHVLDTRQHRSDQTSCTPAQRLPSGYCPDTLDPARSILGVEQRSWLLDGLNTSTARWNVLANQVQFAPVDQNPAVDARMFSPDGWDGYVADRQGLLDTMAAHPERNHVVITGDAHVHSARNVPPDFERFDGPPVAAEFVGTSISTNGDPAVVRTFGPDANNPHRLFQNNQRGYVRVDVAPGVWTAQYRIVTTVLAPTSPAATLATFAVEDGTPGAVRV